MSNGDLGYIINLDPYLESVLAVLDVLQAAGLIPNLDPLQLIFDAFDGKPKLEDTELAALRLQASPWWPLRALGSNLQIWVRNGVPLSTGKAPLRAQLSEWIRGTIDSLEPIVYGRFNPYSLDHAIWLSMTSEQGDTAIVQLNKTIAEQHALGPLPQVPGSQPTTPPPFPDVGARDDPNDDELGDYQQTLIFQNTIIYDRLVQIATELSKEGQGDCCVNVVKAIAAVTGQLTIIAAAFAAGGPVDVKVDFGPVTAAIAELVAAIGAYPPALAACCAAINVSLGGIKDAITNAPGTDTKGIIDTLNKLVAQGDVDNAIFQALQQTGTLSPADLQTLQGIKWSDALSYILSTAPWRTFQRIGKVVEADYDAINNAVVNFNAAVDNWAAKETKKGLTIERNLLQAAITPILDAVKSALRPTGIKQIGTIGVNPDRVLADVAAVALNVQAVATLISLAREGAGEQISKLGEYAAGLLGFEELREVQLGPLVDFGIARIAELQAKKLFGQELPGAGALAALAARGLITGAQYLTWVPYTGLPGELWEQTRESAYSGLGARRILPLVQTGLFSQADIADELTFSGLRPASMKRYLLAAPYLATNTERNTLRSTIEKAYIAGLLSDADLQTQVDGAEQNTDRDALILQRCRLEKLIAGVKDLEAEYTTMYLGGLIDDPTYRSYLQGIGLQPDMLNFIAGKAEARANATLHRKELAAAAALQRATAAVERQAALKNFEEGNLSLPLYTAALIETGLTPIQAAAWSDLAALKKEGNVRWVYGLQLSPQAATILKERVGALTDQRKRQLITQQDYVKSLSQLGISLTWINGLDAAAEAMLSPKTSAFAVQVQT